MTQEGELLWEPDQRWTARARVTAFMAWLSVHRGHTFSSYDELWRWSVTDLEGFWSAIADWLGVRWRAAPGRALGDASMPGAEWFQGSRLNYAEHLLFPAAEVADTDVAVVFAREDGMIGELSLR